jgi:chemotaxis protein methyltransferase CheR
MLRYEIGIVETRNVIKAILDMYGYDFRDYALTSFKRRLEDTITAYGLKDADGLISRIQNNKGFLDHFLKDINPETTEMFRDPSLWRSLREEILPDIVRSTSKPKIWVGALDSGEELYSLCIVLKEIDLLDKFNIYSSYISEETVKKIKGGKIEPKQHEANDANYQRSNGVKRYSDYFPQGIGTVMSTFNVDLIDGVTFVKQDSVFSNPPSSLKLVLFRNQIIYFNQILQDKVLNKIQDALVPGGYLVLGVKESLENTNANNKFTVTNDAEKIYKKKTG